jgi:hypothetical protein
MKKIYLLAVSLFCLAAVYVNADTTVLSFSPGSYIERCLAESQKIAAQAELVTNTELALEELRISDSSEFDLAAADLDVQVERAKLSELSSATVTDALADFASLYFAGRNSAHATTALAIAAEKEAAAKNQAAEGVKNELDYYGEYLAYRNAEIAKLSADYAYDNALRRFMRRVPDSVHTEIRLIDTDVQLPGSLPYSAEQAFERAKSISSSFLRAAGNADIQIRRYAVYSELETTAKTLRNLKTSEQAAIRGRTAQANALEDRAWALIQQLHVLESKAAVGTEQLRVAELRWEERKRGFSFGVVTERQLREHELAREREIDAQKRKGYDLLTHYLRTIAFMGGDPLSEGDALLN